jgi:hypothetical protein
MDAKTLFEEKLPDLLRRDPARGRSLDAIYAFDIAGDGGGQWTVDLKADPPTVASGRRADATCAIEITAADFAEMLADPQRAIQLYFEQRLKVIGDPTAAARLHVLFGEARTPRP